MRKKIFLAGLISLGSAQLDAINTRLIVPVRTLLGLQEAYMRRLQSYQHPFLIPLVTIPLATYRRDGIEEAEQRFNSQPMMQYRSSSLDADLLAQIMLYRHLQNICDGGTPTEVKLTLNLTHTKLQDELAVLVPGASLDDVLADIEKVLEKQKGETCPAQASSSRRRQGYGGHGRPGYTLSLTKGQDERAMQTNFKQRRQQ